MRRLASHPAYLQANKSSFAFVRGKSKKSSESFAYSQTVKYGTHPMKDEENLSNLSFSFNSIICLYYYRGYVTSWFIKCCNKEMQQDRNIHAIKEEHWCKGWWTYGWRNAKEREHDSYKSGTFFRVMQQDRNFLSSKCNKRGTFRQPRNKTGTFHSFFQ